MFWFLSAFLLFFDYFCVFGGRENLKARYKNCMRASFKQFSIHKSRKGKCSLKVKLFPGQKSLQPQLSSPLWCPQSPYSHSFFTAPFSGWFWSRAASLCIILVCFNVLIINKVGPEDADQAEGVMDKLGYSLGSWRIEEEVCYSHDPHLKEFSATKYRKRTFELVRNLFKGPFRVVAKLGLGGLFVYTDNF